MEVAGIVVYVTCQQTFIGICPIMSTSNIILYISELKLNQKNAVDTSDVTRNFVRGDSTNSVEDRGQRERGSGGGSPLERGSAQFANE
jgi:hypothetical protein